MPNLNTLRALDSKYISGRTAKFRYKIFINSGVTKLHISTTKSLSFCYVSYFGSDVCWQINAPTHIVRETVQLLTRKTPDYIAATLWSANSPDLSPFKLPDLDLGKAAGARVLQPDSWRLPAEAAFDRKVETFQQDDQLIIDEAVRQWRSRRQACIWACGEYFEHVL